MSPTEPGAAHRVLLVDDDEAVRAMMNATLERKGFEVVVAANGGPRGLVLSLERFLVFTTPSG